MRGSLVGLVLQREIIELWRTRQLPLLIIGCVLLLGIATFLGVVAHNDYESSRQYYEETNWKEWTEQEAKNPHSAAHFGQYVFKSELPIAAIDPGIRAVQGKAMILETHHRGDWLFPPVNDESPAARMTRVSVANLLQVIGPLIVFLLGFRTYSAERERGTLAWVVATSANPFAIMLGKALAILIGSTVLLLPILAYVLWLLVNGQSDGQRLERLGAMALLYLAYLTVFVMMTVSISARSKNSAQAMASLLLIWVLMCIAAPRLGVLMAEVVVPTPSEGAFNASLRHDLERTENGEYWADQQRARLREETLKKYGVEKIKDLPVGYSGIMLANSEQHSSDVYTKHYHQLALLHDRQNIVHQLVSGLFGPLMATVSLSAELTSSGSGAYRRFEQVAERYRQELIEKLNNTTIHSSHGDGWGAEVDRAFYLSIPRFQSETSRRGIIKTSATFSAVAILGVWLVLSGLFAWTSVQTLQVR